MTKAETRQKAELAYNTALQTGACEDWEKAARLLYQALPATRQKGPKVKPYKRGKCRNPFPTAVATFTDGSMVTMSFWSHRDGPIDFDRARRVCERIWRKRAAEKRYPIHGGSNLTAHDFGIIARTKRLRRHYERNVTPPAILEINEITTGENWRPEQAEAA